MLSKQDAMNAGRSVSTNYGHMCLIEKIYDSIGRCDECSNSYIGGPNLIGGSMLKCKLQEPEVNTVRNYDFCSKYKEKKKADK